MLYVYKILEVPLSCWEAGISPEAAEVQVTEKKDKEEERFAYNVHLLKTWLKRKFMSPRNVIPRISRH